MKFILASFSAAFLTVSALAESPFEREMKQLKTQRDAAVLAATKAQDERYRTALEQVFQRATQAKDPGAEAIKAELLTLGPLRELPALGAATAVKPALPSTMFGGWTVGDATGWKAVYNFKADGTCECIPGSAKIPEKIGQWSKSGQKIEIVWPDGIVHAFDLPIKAGKLEGYTPSGARLGATKVR
jgi:hypothetical protein